MALTDTQLAKVRRMVNEPGEDGTYSDEIIQAIADEHTFTVNNWPDEDSEVYDLHAIAAEIWAEKAAALQSQYDRDADGADLKRSQPYAHAMKQAEYHSARRRVRSTRLTKAPREEQEGSL